MGPPAAVAIVPDRRLTADVPRDTGFSYHPCPSLGLLALEVQPRGRY